MRLKNKVRETGPILFLSLFLLLLAFFILLNSVSTFEELKSKRVIDSVVATFRSPEEQSSRVEIFTSSFEDIEQPEELLDYIEQLWVSSVSVVDKTRSETGSQMELVIPLSELYETNANDVRPDRIFLLDAIGQALGQNIPTVQLSMTFQFEISNFNELVRENLEIGNEDPINAQDPGIVIEKDGNTSLGLIRIETIANELFEVREISPEFVKVGFVKGENPNIRLRFFTNETLENNS